MSGDAAWVAGIKAYAALFERSPDGVMFTAPNGTVLAVNESACRMLGRSEAEILRMWNGAVVDASDPRWSTAFVARATDGYFNGELRARRSDGSTFLIDLATSVITHNGFSLAFVGFRDLSRYVQVVERAGDMQRAAATVIDTLESISDSYFAVDKTWVITYINARAEELLRVARWDTIGVSFWDAFPHMRGTVFEEHYRRVLRTGRAAEFEGYYAATDLRCEVRAFPLHGGGMGVYFRDIAERYAAQRERDHLLASERLSRAVAEAAQRELTVRATHDNVTGLLNRWGLLEEVDAVLSAAPGSPLTVMFIDLDRFKLVNDTLGHVVGDQLLAVVAERLRSLVRPTDLLARFGGDEFIIVLPDSPLERVEALARRIVATSAEPVAIGHTLLPITASVGIARAEGSTDIDTLLREADAALYRVKDAGRDGFAWFDEGLHRETVHRVQTERDLRHGLASGDQLLLHYQPAFSLATGTATHVEALARWRQPNRTLVQPGDFIPVAEESGLILTLGDGVIAQAADQAARWAHVPDIRVWVNVSPRQLALPGLAEQLRDHLRDAGVPPERFGIEVTESTVADTGRLIDNLQAVHDIGVAIAIDDFGTGYSSLSRLAKMPVDVIKIDQSFVRSVGTPTGDAMLAGIVSLAHSIGAHVIAEGVETLDQLAALTAAGADDVTGFLLARPCPADEVTWHSDVPLEHALGV